MSESEDWRESALVSLGLGPGADEGEIRTAYRRLAMRYHPDVSGDPHTARRFARVVRAYKVLATKEGEASRRSGTRYRSVENAGGDLFSLGQVVASDPDAGARGAAARALGLSGRSAAYIFLRRALYDPAEDVALEAVRAVALLGSRQAEGEVAALFIRSSTLQKARLLELAMATGERLFRTMLQAAAEDSDFQLCAMAERCLRSCAPRP